MTAQELRETMRARRAALGEGEQRLAGQAVSGRIMALEAYQNARVVMAYMAARGELSVRCAMEDALARGKTLALPRCIAPGVMRAYAVRSLSELRPGRYGILEPGEDCPEVEPQDIGLVLTPGTAFDRQGGRIGQGGGYYDRFLPGTPAVRVGVCHDFALFARLPQGEHDARMHAVCTPTQTIQEDEP